MTDSTFCSFCDTHAVGHLAAPTGPWFYCANHISAAADQAEAEVKAIYVAGTIERPSYQLHLAAIHAAKAEAGGYNQCVCGACREVRG